MEYYVSYDRALEIVLSQELNLPEEEVFFTQALGRVLAEDVYADYDSPPAPLSAMDGYALNSKELPGKFKVVGEVPAGSLPNLSPSKGETVKVFTGSLIPPGCDAVVPVEQVRLLSKEEVFIDKIYPSGYNVRPVGEDFSKGTLLLRKGETLGPSEIGLLTTSGKVQVKVKAKPKVAVIATGSEVVEPYSPLNHPYQIRNVNAYTLTSMLLESGAEPSYLGLIEDLKEEVKEVLDEALSRYPIVITSGGISAGDYDFIRDALPEIGVEPLFYKCKVKPGKPVFFGKRKGSYLFALPGFPVSTVVSFYGFVYPFLRKALGCRELFKKRVKAKLLEPFKRKKVDRLEFVRCSYSFNLKEAVYVALPYQRQGSGVLTSLRGKTALMPVPVGVDFYPEGALVELILIKEG
ncbi:molybdopterin molybdotransferase MoeA [Thermovibrio sp.]